MAKRFKVLTLGCKVNQYESRGVEEALSARGAVKALDGEAVDLAVINTCTVTHRSDADARAMLRRVRREHPNARVVVTGCYAKLEPARLYALGADLVVASTVKEGLAEEALSSAVGVVEGITPVAGTLAPEEVSDFGERARAYFKVQDGCDCYCAYCIVPYARGPSRSLGVEEVERGLSRLARSGKREVVLTGIHIGHWGRDLVPERGFMELLELAERSGVERVRISSIEPLELTDGVIDRIGASSVICPHLHVPLQSGASRILGLMGRPYDREVFGARMERAFEGIEDLCLGLDVIVGFPGEGEEDFADTLGLLESLPLAYLHVFPYSPRKGTRAYEMEGRVDPGVVKARAKALRELSARKKEQYYRRFVGRKMKVLPERELKCGMMRGRTANYLEVDYPAGSDGAAGGGWPIVAVRLKGIEAGRLRGGLEGDDD